MIADKLMGRVKEYTSPYKTIPISEVYDHDKIKIYFEPLLFNTTDLTSESEDCKVILLRGEWTINGQSVPEGVYLYQTTGTTESLYAAWGDMKKFKPEQGSSAGFVAGNYYKGAYYQTPTFESYYASSTGFINLKEDPGYEVFSADAPGLVPAGGKESDLPRYLRADGQWEEDVIIFDVTISGKANMTLNNAEWIAANRDTIAEELKNGNKKLLLRITDTNWSGNYKTYTVGTPNINLSTIVGFSFIYIEVMRTGSTGAVNSHTVIAVSFSENTYSVSYSFLEFEKVREHTYDGKQVYP